MAKSEKTLLDGLPLEFLREQVRAVIEPVLSQELSPPACEHLVRYLQLVTQWGKRVDLVAPRDLTELLELSFVDAAVVARFEGEFGRTDDRFVDVGSGGGAPGIPLVVLLRALRGACRMTLVEPRTKRAAFLRTVAGGMEGGVPEVLRCRSDVLGSGAFDVALARATLPPADWLQEGARLARRAVWVLLAREDLPVLEGYEVQIDHRYQLPSSGAPRRAVRVIPRPRSGPDGVS